MQTRVKHEHLDPHRGAHTLLFTAHEAGGQYAEDGIADPHKEWDDTVCRAMGRILHSEYRGHDWQVWVSREAGIAKIWIALLMDPTVPYVIHLTELLQPKDVIRAGGELLERFSIPRSTVDFGLVADIRKKMGPLVGRIVAPGGNIKGQ
jgi:hypothetical protein